MDRNRDGASIFEQFKDFFDTDTVVGQPVEVGEITLIPLVSISFGSASGSGPPSRFKLNTGSGAGMAGRITPVAVVAVKGNDVSVYSLTGKGLLDKLDDLMPVVTCQLNKNPRPQQESKTSDPERV